MPKETPPRDPSRTVSFRGGFMETLQPQNATTVLERPPVETAGTALPREAARVIEEPLPERQAVSGAEDDVAVIGAGPGGYVAASRAAQLAVKVAVIEKGPRGGTWRHSGG